MLLESHYRSLSLMQGDDLTKALQQQSQAQLELQASKKEEVDDISSIQSMVLTGRQSKINLENTLRKRDQLNLHKKHNKNISIMNENDAFDIMNINK